jgi:hypothetical protein
MNMVPELLLLSVTSLAGSFFFASLLIYAYIASKRLSKCLHHSSPSGRRLQKFFIVHV